MLVAPIFKKNFSFISFNKAECEAHLLDKKRLLRMSQVASVFYDALRGLAIINRTDVPSLDSFSVSSNTLNPFGISSDSIR